MIRDFFGTVPRPFPLQILIDGARSRPLDAYFHQVSSEDAFEEENLASFALVHRRTVAHIPGSGQFSYYVDAQW